MSTSKLMKVTYYDPKSQIRLICYADTVVWDTKPTPTLTALRFGGYPERVQGLADAIYGGATIEIEDGKDTHTLKTLTRQYRRELSHDGVYAEATLIAEDDGQSSKQNSGEKDDQKPVKGKNDENDDQIQQDLPPRNTYIFCTPGEHRELFDAVDQKTAVPMIPEYQDYVLTELQKRNILRPLQVKSLSRKLEAWLLRCEGQDKNIVAVMEDGLKSGAIAIPGSKPGVSPLDEIHSVTEYLNTFGVTVAEQIKKLFDDAVERYNVGKRKDRQIANYYEKIRQGKQEKLFHEVIFQIGNREDMAVGTTEGNLAVKVLDEYVKDFQKRNPTLRVFSCYLHQDEATPHLHIDFVPYVTNWKGKGMDTRVSLKQALKSLGFQGGNKHDTELNQWINHEKEVLAEIAKQHGIEWEQKGTHEEHLDVYNFKKKERKKEVQELEQEKEYLTAENEGLTSQIADARADIKLLEEEKIQFQKDKETAEKRAGKAEMELKKLEDRREFLQPVMDNVSKEIKEYGMIKTFLPEATVLERAVTYRDKKIKPLFIEMKNKIGAMAAQVKELTRERDNWKSKFQQKKKEHEATKKELAEVQKDYQKLSGEKEILQGLADRYNRLLRMLGKDMVERLVQDDIRMQAELEAKKQKEQKEQMPKKIGDRIQWARERSEEHNAQIKKNKTKYRGMEL